VKTKRGAQWFASGVTVQSGASNVYYYDLGGQRISSVGGQGNWTRMEYNVLSKVIRQVEYANGLSGWDDSSPPSPPLASVNDYSTSSTTMPWALERFAPVKRALLATDHQWPIRCGLVGGSSRQPVVQPDVPRRRGQRAGSGGRRR